VIHQRLFDTAPSVRLADHHVFDQSGRIALRGRDHPCSVSHAEDLTHLLGHRHMGIRRLEQPFESATLLLLVGREILLYGEERFQQVLQRIDIGYNGSAQSPRNPLVTMRSTVSVPASAMGLLCVVYDRLREAAIIATCGALQQ
jgi:hypothetical protein